MKCSPSLPASLLFCLSSYATTILAANGPLQDVCPTATQVESAVFINGFLCKSPATITAADFKSVRLNHSGDTDNFQRSSLNMVTAAEFPGLNTLGLSIARTDLAIDGMVPLHSHPRASEMFYVSKGIIIAGFIDAKGRLFPQLLREGDVYVFPQGLLHFSMNAGFEPATAFSVLNSQNPGVASLSDAMFLLDADNLKKLREKLLRLSAKELHHIGNETLADLQWDL